MRNIGSVVANRHSGERNRKVAVVLIGIMLLLVAVSIVTILLEH